MNNPQQMQSTSDNKRIAKNTLMLYIRMGLSTIIGLYTSRVVLQVLGVSDYGIYSVVGGIIAFMSFLNASMSGATSRFITFELGKKDKKRLNDTFSSALLVHIFIAIIILVIAETIGLWFLNHKLVIPQNQMYAAQWVYQLSILSAIVSITQVPYNACIIAHEKMDVYAYIEILNVVLKLLIVYLLLVVTFNKLILYALLVFGVSTVIASIYRFYCIRKFSECHFHLHFDKKILKPMLSFSTWDLYGNMSYSAKEQGTNFIINIFYGVTLNAATGIANSVNCIIKLFSYNVIIAFQPQIVKNYATNNIKEMEILLGKAIKYTLILSGLIIVPLLFELHYIMNIWLTTIPPHSVEFCKIILLTTLIGLINSILIKGIHATGRIKTLSLITGTSSLINLPIIYILYQYSYSPNFAFWTSLGIMPLTIIAELWLIRHLIPTINIKSIINNIFIGLFVVSISSVVPLIIWFILKEGFIRFILVLSSYILSIYILSYQLIFEETIKLKINSFIKYIN